MENCEVYAKLTAESLKASSTLSWCLIGMTNYYTQDLGLQYIDKYIFPFLANIKELLKNTDIMDFKQSDTYKRFMLGLENTLKSCIKTVNAENPKELFPGANLDVLNTSMYRIIEEVKEINNSLATN